MMLKDVYGKFNSAVLSAHYRTNGLSTLFFTRWPAIISGIAAGIMTLDNILDFDLFGLAQADPRLTEAPPGYVPSGGGGVDENTCETYDLYVPEYIPGSSSTDIIEVRTGVIPNCTPKVKNSRDSSLESELCLPAVILAIGAAGGGYFFYRGLKTKKTRAMLKFAQSSESSNSLESSIKREKILHFLSRLEESYKSGELNSEQTIRAISRIRTAYCRLYYYGKVSTRDWHVLCYAVGKISDNLMNKLRE